MFFLSMGDGQQSRMGTGRKAGTHPTTSSTVCTSLGTESCPGTQHSRPGCDTAFPAPGWGRTLEKHPPSCSLLRGKGFLLKESSSRRGEAPAVTGETILHLVLLPSHIWRKREIKQHRVETWGILRAAEIGTTTLPERASPRDRAARGNDSPPPAPCEREDTPTPSSGLSFWEASRGSDCTAGRDCDCPWKLRQEKQFLSKMLILPHCFLARSQPSNRSLSLPCRLCCTSYPNASPQMVPKPERGQGAPKNGLRPKMD